MKTKKLLFLTTMLMVFSATISFAQPGDPAPCGVVKPYYNANAKWYEPTTVGNAGYKEGQEESANVDMSAGTNIIVGVDPKANADNVKYALVITVNGTEVYNGATGDISVVNPVPNVGDKATVVVLYTDDCGTFTYTWNVTGTPCIPVTPPTLAPFYNPNNTGWKEASANTIPGRIEVFTGDSILFGPNPTDGKYKWLWTGDCTADLTSTIVREPTLTASASCALTATFTYDNGCGNAAATSSYTYNVIVDGVELGVDKFEQGGFNMYLNQADKNLNITFNGDLNVSIINISGQKILSRAISKQASIDVSSLSSGVYFLKAVANGESMVKKFIKN